MILRMPDYFPEFACIADKCTDSCCVGWEIDLDDDTSDYYKSIEEVKGLAWEVRRSHGSLQNFC